jgi:hypothetical protein
MHFRQVQIYEKKWFMPKKPVIQIQVLTLYFEGSLKSSTGNIGINKYRYYKQIETNNDYFLLAL